MTHSYTQISFCLCFSTAVCHYSMYVCSTGLNPHFSSQICRYNNQMKALMECNLRGFFLTAPSASCCSSSFTDSQTSWEELISLHFHLTVCASHSTHSPSVISPSNCVLLTLPVTIPSLPGCFQPWGHIRLHYSVIFSVREINILAFLSRSLSCRVYS